MDSYNILIIDDEYTNLNAMKNALIKFGYQKEYIYPPTVDEIKSFSAKIMSFAQKQQYDDMYYYIFRYIEKKNISAIFLDLNHDKNSAATHDRPDHSSGERLGLSLISNKLHNKIPIVIYTRYAQNDQDINKTIIKTKSLQTHIGGELYSTESIKENFTSDSVYDLLITKGFKKERIDKRVEEYLVGKRATNISVLCALKLEFDAVVNMLEDTEEDHTICGKAGYIRDKNGNIYKVGVDYMKDEDFGFYAMSECQDKVHIIIKHCKPEYLVMTGVMGGVEEKVQIGDVIVGNKAFEWDYSRDLDDKDYGKKERPSFSYSGSLKNSIDLLIKNSSSIVGDKKNKALFNAQEDLKIKIGLIGTGNRVLNDKNKLNRLIEAEPHMLGFEMEIASLYRVVDNIDEIRTVSLKTVVDYGDETKGKEYQKSGAKLSAHVFYKLFTEYIDIG